jgi:hypothetical protein
MDRAGAEDCHCGKCKGCIIQALSAPEPVFGPVLVPEKEAGAIFARPSGQYNLGNLLKRVHTWWQLSH